MRSKSSSEPSKPKSFAEEHCPAFSPESILPRLQPLEGPKFPTLSDLAKAPELPTVSAVPQPKRLYEALVSNPLVLYHSYLDDPESFEEGTAELIQELMTGRRSYDNLNAEELSLLDRAAVQMAHARTPREKERARAMPEREGSSLAIRAAQGELDSDGDDFEIPDIVPTTRWWNQ